MQNRPDGVLGVLIGVSRSGKSVYLKALIESVGRAVAFDPKGEYVRDLGFRECKTLEQLISAFANSPGNAKIAFVSMDKRAFQLFCKWARVWNRQRRAVIILEELAFVTNAGKAEGHYGELLCQSLAEGPVIIGTCQRGQEVDKTILNNATYVHITRHSTENDRKYIAGQLGVPLEQIPDKPLHFLQWTSYRGVVARGQIDFLKSRKRKAWPQGGPRFKTYEGEELHPSEDGHFHNIQYVA